MNGCVGGDGINRSRGLPDVVAKRARYFSAMQNVVPGRRTGYARGAAESDPWPSCRRAVGAYILGLPAAIAEMDRKSLEKRLTWRRSAMMTVQRLVLVALILLVFAFILTLIAIFYEGFSLVKLWGLLSVIAGLIIVYFYMLPASKVVRATFVMPPDGIEDRVTQAMAAIGFTIEPHSQIGNSFTFRATGARLVVTETTSGIEVAGPSGAIDNLASKLGIVPHKNA
jgi:hypothetical protein